MPGQIDSPARAGWTTRFRFVGALLQAYIDDEVPRLGAAIAFYALFSLAPLLTVIILVAGSVLGMEAAREQFLLQIGGLVGQSNVDTLAAMLDSAQLRRSGAIATVVGIGTLLVGTTGVFVELKHALDRVRSVDMPEGLSMLVRARLLSLALVLATGFLTLVSLIISAALALMSAWLSTVPWLAAVAIVIDVLVPLSLIALFFAMLLRWLPTHRSSWRAVWPGALLAAVLFEVGKHLVGVYLGRAAFASAFGAAGSLVVLVVWVYYCTQVVLIGAELNKLLDRRHRAPDRARMRA